MIKLLAKFITLTLMAYSAQSSAGWEIYDDFNDDSFDITKWSHQLGGPDYFNFSEGNGTLRGYIPTGVNEGPGTSFDFLPIHSTFIEGLKGVRVKLFISDTCAEDDVVGSMILGISARGLKYRSVTSFSNMKVVITNSDLNRITVSSGTTSNLKRSILRADLDSETSSDPGRFTGKWIKITQYFANPKNLRFWTNLDDAEAQIKYTNKNFEAKWGSTFSISLNGSYVDPHSTSLCRIWIDNIDIYR